MNYLLGQLEEFGYLVRGGDPEDRRSRRVHLTERGRVVAQTMRGTVTAIERRLEEELGREDLNQLRELLTRLNASTAVSGDGGGQ